MNIFKVFSSLLNLNVFFSIIFFQVYFDKDMPQQQHQQKNIEKSNKNLNNKEKLLVSDFTCFTDWRQQKLLLNTL